MFGFKSKCRSKFYTEGVGAGARFNVGESVERIGALVHPPYLRTGVVIRVIQNTEGFDLFTQYEVSFDDSTVVTLFKTQLREMNPAKHD